MALSYRVKRLLTRPRAFLRAWRGIGLISALKLIRIRAGSRDRIYHVRVPQWPHPVFVRGGDSTDAVVLYEILVTNEYDHVGDLGTPKFMIDGGANIGFAALYFLNRYPGLHVVAVEPDPATIDLCRKNLAPYGDRTTILEGALWNYPGRICLQSNHEEFATSVRDAGEGEDGSIEAFTVPGVIASHLRDLPVDLLKLDVEGGEKAIFQPGGLEWLARVRNIVIELHGPDCEELFFAALKPYRYRLERRDSVCFCEDLHPVANDRQN